MKRITCLAILFAMTMGISAQTQTQVKMQIWKNGKPTNYVVSTEIDSITFLEETITPKTVKGTKIWPIVLDGTSVDANASKIVADFRPDDVGRFLYIWENTYVANYNPTALNFHGNNEGYVSLTVAAPAGWSGLGFCLGETSAAAAESLRQAIVANPDKYFLHLAMKATTPGNHQFYTFNDAVTSFAVGTATIEAGAVIGDFTRDGSWAEFDVPMANFAAALANLTFPTGGNIFCALSGGATGSQLNLDAVYFYEK